MNVSLLTPTTDLQEEYLDFYSRMEDSGETMIRGFISKSCQLPSYGSKNFSMRITE